MSHDYDPNWDYPCVELEQLEDLTAQERAAASEVVERVRTQLAPAMGFEEGIEVFFVEPQGLSSVGNEHMAVAVFCSGTSSRPVIGFDLSEMKRACEAYGLGLAHQLDLSLAHELGHAHQERCGLDLDHDDGLDEDDAEAFGVAWADYRLVDLKLLERAEHRRETD